MNNAIWLAEALAAAEARGYARAMTEAADYMARQATGAAMVDSHRDSHYASQLEAHFRSLSGRETT
jgi:hypothetical protein